jgi:2-keto-4-pentenoate hydratase/2-oxohepta-3-ene-1,7-dioic acid hydratase in catechol pathway
VVARGGCDRCERRQDPPVANLIFNVSTEVISAGITLEPGDIIATGTPAGSASASILRASEAGRRGAREVAGIGTLENPIA